MKIRDFYCQNKKGNVVNVYSIATLDFIENNKNRYDYNKSIYVILLK